jgi:hypothetical protein
MLLICTPARTRQSAGSVPIVVGRSWCSNRINAELEIPEAIRGRPAIWKKVGVTDSVACGCGGGIFFHQC